MSTISRFSVRSSGRDLTQVRRPAKATVKVAKASAPKASPATDDATVTHAKATEPKASPADKKATVKPSKADG